MKPILLQLCLLFIFLSARVVNACINGEAALFVQETIDKNQVVIFSKTYCKYSTLAKEQFEQLNVPFLTVELDNRHDGAVIQAILGEITDATTVPRVFVDGKFIGGGTEVKQLNKSGELKKLLGIRE